MLQVVVVSYKVPHLLKECVSSILYNTSISYQLDIVDNNSGEETTRVLTELKGIHPNINVYYLKENIGYGAAANLVINEGKENYVLLLNNDVVITSGYERIVHYLLDHPEVGIAGPKLVNHDNRIVGTGVTQSRSYSTVRGWLHPNSDTAFNEIEDVIYVGGAALFMSRKCLEDIKENGKYFDEQFDFYFEDFDLALRAQEKGYKVQYCPLSTFIHCHEGSLRECQPGEMGSRDWRHRKHFENRDKFVKKWPMIRV